MAYRRAPRPSFYFDGRTRTGWKQLCAHTPAKRLASKIEQMWAELAERHRAWDLLEPVLTTPRTITALWDLWDETRHDIEEIRRRRNDVDVEPIVSEWYEIYSKQVEVDTANHALVHVRHFLPEGTPRLRSAITKDWLTTELAKYPGKRNTRRKVHSSMSVFLDYCVMTKGLFALSPMLMVPRPKLERALPAFYDVATVRRIVDWQPTTTRQAFFALVYGTGADVSPALLVHRSDFDQKKKEVRIMGTKSAGRDRIVRIADSLWPIVWAHAKTVLSGRVFPNEWSRWTVSDWHRQTVGEGTKDTHGNVEQVGLRLPRQLPLRKARHHFATRLLQAGTPVRIVSEQLGSDERTVLKHYGPWITSPDDRAKWETLASAQENGALPANDPANSVESVANQ